MSQVNVQQLLKLDPVSPTQVSSTPVDYNTSSFQGGGFRPGQLAQLPKSSEQSLYESLSSIAGGVRQGIDTFSQITSQIDKERINKVEAEWERLDALDIDPRDKVTEFNSYLSGVETPITGETWKKRIAARVSKSWGKEAFEKFVESEYTSQLKKWPKFDGKMGPVLTQEFLDQFNEQNPSLTGSDFISGLILATKAKLREKEDILTSNALVQAVNLEYKFTPEQISGIASKALDIDELRKTSPKVVQALELAAASDSADDFDSLFTRIFYEELAPQLGTLDPEVQSNALERLDQARITLSKELWRSSRIIISENEKFRRQASLEAMAQSFRANPTSIALQNLAEDANLNLRDVPVASQAGYFTAIAETLYAGLASNKFAKYSNFNSVPVSRQLEVVEELLKEVFPESTFLSGVYKEGALGYVKNYQEAIDQIMYRFRNSKNGQDLQGSALQTLASKAETIKSSSEFKMAWGGEVKPAELTTAFIRAISEGTGIKQEIIERIFLVTTTVDGETQRQPRLASAKEILNDPVVRDAFSKIGFGEPQLNEILKYHAGLMPTGGTSGRGGKVSLQESKAPDQETAQRIVLTKPELIPSAIAILSNPENHDRIEIEAANRILQESVAIDGQLATLVEESVLGYLAGQATGVVEQQRFEENVLAWQKRQAGTATLDEIKLADQFIMEKINPTLKKLYNVDSPSEITFYERDESGNIIPLQPNVFLDRKNWVDENNNLTPNGRRLGLRLTMEAKLWAGLPREEGQSKYVNGLREQMTTLSKAKGLDQADPALLYSTMFALKGLKSGVSEPIGLVGSNEKNDSIFFDYFLEFMTIGQIPDNFASIDEKTNIFLNAFNVAIETLNMPQNFGSLDQPVAQGADSSRESVIRGLVSIGTGNGKSLLPEGQEEGTAITLRLGEFFRFPGINKNSTDDENAKIILKIFHKIASGILTSDSNSESGNFIVPDPNRNDSTLYEIPSSDGKVLRIAWNKMTADQKLTWYFNNLLDTNNTELFTAFIYPAVATQIMDQAEFRGVGASRNVDRLEAVMNLMGARNVYLQRRQKTGAVPFFTLSYVGKGGKWDPTSSWQLVAHNKQFLPQVNTRNTRLQPQRLIHDALSGSFIDGMILDWNTIEDRLDDVSQDVEDTAENVAASIHGVPQAKRHGLGLQMDPADQFVLGISALPAREQTVDYFFDVLGFVDANNQPITMKSLLAKAGPDRVRYLQKVMERYDTPVVSFIANNFPEYMNVIQQRMIQFGLGKGNIAPNSKVRFSVSVDGTEPVLVFNPNVSDTQIGPELALRVKEVPKTSVVLESNKQIENDGLYRWAIAYELLKEMQDNPKKWNNSETEE